MNAAAELIESLPVQRRLALAYAPGRLRIAYLGLLALDLRLGMLLRQAREPLLAQLKLAWWRDRLAEEPARWPEGEPLLASLREWPVDRSVLAALVDAWEGMLGEPPLAQAAMLALADARAGAFAVLAPAGFSEAGWRMGRNWGLADVALHLSHPEEREAALALARAADWRAMRLPSAMRPLAVLHALAARDLRREGKGDKVSPGALLVAMRAGLIGF